MSLCRGRRINTITDEFFENGKMFDGSSIAGWKGINESDMLLMPDTETAVVQREGIWIMRCVL